MTIACSALLLSPLAAAVLQLSCVLSVRHDLLHHVHCVHTNVC